MGGMGSNPLRQKTKLKPEPHTFWMNALAIELVGKRAASSHMQFDCHHTLNQE